MIKRVPKLRFPEFTGEWEEKRLGEIADIVGGGTPSTDVPKYWNGEINWFTPTEVGSQKYVSNSERRISERGYKSSSAKLLPKGAILLSTRATLGEMSILLGEATTNQGFQSLIAKDGISGEFIYYNQPKIKRHCFINASGSTFLEINKYNLSKLKISLPSLPEQEKIANFLSAIDEQIETKEENLKNLEEMKKGFMQKIFSKELRFKDEDGSEYPEWEEKKLGEMVSVISSNLSLLDATENGEYPLYDANNIIGKTSKAVGNPYVSIIKDGAGVGRIRLLPKNSFFISTMNGLVSKEGDIVFLYYMLSQLDFTKYIVGSGIPHIYFKDYKIERFQLPSLPEQEKIANFLSTLDEKIEIEKEATAELKEIKKGLLQQMFV